ncbi:MAG: Undecaprenyl-phosphate glucose phosphotransferase [Candidatus Magasanikbacteria bacterium GW2011_GWC2_45_8]|uniref:Undecaprenyl-phosphate glucose phosphotransferase n=1 Tax=Candidatus Magasanikbacteria bacterium GW2011_GWC2_45_8 TaxID=1619050 RepID=A0A0G1QXK4_9BACT|nr:MAG: Undecaprenyl-phosphate glucose phosphotransferase [Candidatus Magasanikbacteria bacterium GW2011_GWC2_45_8]
MNITKKFIFTVSHVPMDYLMLLGAGASAYGLRFTKFFTNIKPIQFNLAWRAYWPSMMIVALVWIIFFALSGLYKINPNRKLANDISRVFFACSTGLAAITIFIFFRGELFNSRFIVLAGWMLALVFVCAGRILMRALKSFLFSLGIGVRRVALIGSDHITTILKNALESRKTLGYRIVAHHAEFNEETQNHLLQLINHGGLDEIILTNPKADRDEATAVIEFCENHRLTFKYSADLFATYMSNIGITTVAGIPVVELYKTRLRGWGRVYKRTMDIIGAFILIIITSPLMLISALAVLFETGFPLIYPNERVGENDLHFRALKFRSMYKKYCTGMGNASADTFEENLIKKQNSKTGPVYKIKNDPRVSRVGAFLRATSFDELPQLFNVLKGDMSLVGPRPHQPREVAGYAMHHRRVLNIKPGLTGMAQISGRSDLAFEEEVRLDTFYLEHWSLIIDLVILIKTPFILFKKRRVL